MNTPNLDTLISTIKEQPKLCAIILLFGLAVAAVNVTTLDN